MDGGMNYKAMNKAGQETYVFEDMSHGSGTSLDLLIDER
jgi:hypothetical protein